MRNRLARLALPALILSASAAALHGQDSSSLTGLVQDTSGASLPDTVVTVTNPGTGFTFKTKANASGEYRLPKVPAGPGYSITFTHAGFSPVQLKGVYFNVGATRTQDIKMTAGEATTIEVNASSQTVTLDTNDATIGNNYQVEKLNDLPVYDRSSPGVLFSQEPGVTVTGAALGGRTDQNNVTLDGLDVNDVTAGGAFTVFGKAPIDAVQEFRGTVTGFGANSGQGGGGQFAMVTKSGSNQWHGDLNEYHRDRSTVANDWFNNDAGVPRVQLIRNQFGGALGGPIRRDKAFFFFDFNDSRIAQSTPETRLVPLPNVQAGGVNYINNGAGCTSGSRIDTTPNCITQLTPAQVAALDPLHIGQNKQINALYNNVYPTANYVAGGNGVNTGGFRFNAPLPSFETDYVGRIDYVINANQKIYGRGSIVRADAADVAQEFPSVPVLVEPSRDRSYSWVVSDTWQLGNNKVNQITIGENDEQPAVFVNYNPQGLFPLSFFNGVYTLQDDPYNSPSGGYVRVIPIRQFGDDFTWQKGRHSLNFGGFYKHITANDNSYTDYNSVRLGIGGEVLSLNAALRPSNILNTATGTVTYDTAFGAQLGRIAETTSVFNYDKNGKPIAQGTGSQRQYVYHEVLTYFGDTFKITPHLTLDYGVNWQWYSVPYEANGLETIQNTTFDQYFTARNTQSLQSLSGNNSVPFITYSLGGKANNAPGIYNPSYKDFAPRFGFSYQPAWDPKMVWRGGAGVVFDRTVTNAFQRQQDQNSFLFQQPATVPYGNGANPVASFQNDPRLGGTVSVTAPPTATSPFTPYVDSTGTPIGLANGGDFNVSIDPTLKVPYSIQANFGFQRDLPGHLVMTASWATRLGRRLLAQADANQLVEFPDKTSGELMSTAIANMETELRAGQSAKALRAEPWMENVLTKGVGTANGYANNTDLVADNFSGLLQKGDFADTIQGLAGAGILPANVGMGSQFSENTFYTSKGFSTYNALLLTVNKNLTHGLQFDANYTWSHSIDNVSLVANGAAATGYGFICDVARPRECRASSDFDVTHLVSGNFTYQLPVGRGRGFFSNDPRWVDEIIGGWDVSGLLAYHSGNAVNPGTSAFVASYSNDAPAILVGNPSVLQRRVHKVGNQLFMFNDPTAAAAAFTGPVGFQIGSRNLLRGPQFVNLDAGLAKSFSVLPSERAKLKFRADAFNVLNHPNFLPPAVNSSQIDVSQPGSFGQLISMNSGANGITFRVLQLALRLEF